MGARSEVTAGAGESSVQLAPLWLGAIEPMVDRLRTVVIDDPSLRAAFLYRRAVADADGNISAETLTPTVGLLTVSGSPAATTASRVRRAVGMIHGAVPTMVALQRNALPAVLAVAHPVGAGGEAERAMFGYITAAAEPPVGGRRRPMAPALRLGLAVADAVLTVPTGASDRSQAGVLRAGDDLSLVVVSDGERRFVTAFTSELALLSTMAPTRGAARIRGAVLASSLPDGVEISLDPGCALTCAIGAELVKTLGG